MEASIFLQESNRWQFKTGLQAFSQLKSGKPSDVDVLPRASRLRHRELQSSARESLSIVQFQVVRLGKELWHLAIHNLVDYHDPASRGSNAWRDK
jgi:hypothetical protein